MPETVSEPPTPLFYFISFSYLCCMGFFSNIISATVKTALTPVAIVKDVVNVVTGDEADATKKLLSSAKKDADDAFDDLGDAEL